MRLPIRRPPRVLVIAVAVIAVVGVAVGATRAYQSGDTKTAVAYFSSTTGLYAGDEVRILGVPVGQIDAIEPDGKRVRVKFHYDADQTVPAGAKAVIVAPTLVSSRYLQLAPRYTGGPRLPDGAVISQERTVAPVEWDEVKRQLDAVTKALGTKGANRSGALSDAVSAAAQALDGKGSDIKAAIEGLSRTVELLDNGSQDLFGTVRNLQVFVSALASSSQHITEFSTRLSDVSNLLSNNRQALGTALDDLHIAVNQVASFVQHNRDQIGTTASKLTDLSKILAQEQDELARFLHVAPTPLVDLYNAIKPQTGSIIAQLAVTNFQNPSQFVCSGIAAATNLSPDAVAKTCAKQLGPLLELLTMNYPPLRANPLHRDGSTPVPASPGKRGEHNSDQQTNSPRPEQAPSSDTPRAPAGEPSGPMSGLGDLLLGGPR